MLQATNKISEKILVEMLTLCAFPYMPESATEEEMAIPFLVHTKKDNTTTEWFCEQNQFTVIAVQIQDRDCVELYPDWHCYQEDVEQKEKAIASLHNVFTYKNRRMHR